MTVITICSDFEAQKNSQPLFPHLFAMKWWDQIPMILTFWMLGYDNFEVPSDI